MCNINRIIDILMKRDNISKNEAIELINETRVEIYKSIDYNECISPDEILMDNLGLEPDYLFDII